MKNLEENIIQDSKDSPEIPKREGFEISAEQAGEIASELTELDDAITHDKPISIQDLEDLSKVAKGTKIDVGGEIMTVEEAENIPDLKMNMEIWQEMKEGNFENTCKLTKITPHVSEYLLNIKGDIYLSGLVSAEGLRLPKKIEHSLYLDGLTSAEGLILPEIIEGHLGLSGLTSNKGLKMPGLIRGILYYYN